MKSFPERWKRWRHYNWNIRTSDNYMFEPGYNSPLAKEHIMNWYSYLNAAFGIVEEFNLNTRIWSKP
jgi:hypothetical protein